MVSLRSLSLTLCGACLALGCGDALSRAAPPPDCTAGAGYDLSQVIIDASKISAGAAAPGYGFGDDTPGGLLNRLPQGPGLPSGIATDVPDPTLTCGDARVIDVQSSGHNDYGSSVFINLSSANGTGTDGIFFWARSPVVASDKSVILELSNYYTTSGSGGCVDPPSNTTMNDMGTTTTTTTTPGGSATNQQPNYEPPPGTCDNFFQTVISFTNEWTLYILPYEQFAQLQEPNRLANGFDPTQLDYFAIQIPKEANFELWIDQIGAYKSASATAGP